MAKTCLQTYSVAPYTAVVEPAARSIPEILRAGHDEAGHMSTK